MPLEPTSQAKAASDDQQLEWDNATVRRGWPEGRDWRFVVSRIEELVVEETARGAPGRLLEVAAAEALHSCRLALRGWETYVVEPSPLMLERARGHMARLGSRITLVRGIAETLPFPDRSFDRVLCDSAIDHFASPESGIREMARVLKPDGRLVISFVNYGSLSTRLSRLVSEIDRRLRPPASMERRFWDTPVPAEHTFECTYPIIHHLCDLHLELDRARGISLGWNTPGFGALLARLPELRATRLLHALDRVARGHPSIADVVITVWRPRPTPLASRPRSLRRRGARLLGRWFGSTDGQEPPDSLEVEATDPVYRCRADNEDRYAAPLRYVVGSAPKAEVERRFAAIALTGDPRRSWLDDLIARGSFREAALLGCQDDVAPSTWIRSRASNRITVFEPSAYVIRRLRRDLRGVLAGSRASGARPVAARLVRADLNFIALPAERFDVVLSHGCLSRVMNLERLFSQVEGALRPGGLFAFLDYVGERRFRYSQSRLTRVNAIFAEIPERFRIGGRMAIAAVQREEMSPFAGARSDEILALARRRFELVHEATTGRLFPLLLSVDLVAIEREAPDLLQRLVAAEEEAARDPALAPCIAYVGVRKRQTPLPRLPPAAKSPG